MFCLRVVPFQFPAVGEGGRGGGGMKPAIVMRCEQTAASDSAVQQCVLCTRPTLNLPNETYDREISLEQREKTFLSGG